MFPLIALFPDWFDRALGLDVPPGLLSLGQMCARAAVVFVWGIIIVRLGDRRLLGKNAGFDMLLVVVLGSVLSRAVNGQAAFFPTLGASAALILLHHLLGSAACRSDLLSRALMGLPRTLVRQGRVDHEQLRRSKMSRDDLEENLRLNGNVASAVAVEEARLERNGTISVVKRGDGQ